MPININKRTLTIIIVTAVLLLVICLIPIVEKQINDAKTRDQNTQIIISAMEGWSKGELHKQRLPYISSASEDKLIQKAIEIINRTDTSPKDLGFFLTGLEDMLLNEQRIQKALNNRKFDFEEKILLKNEANLLDYYSLPRITKSDIDEYINQNGKKELYFVSGTGGYYDGKTDSSSKETVGITGSPLYNSESITYFGDFKCVRKSGVRLNSYYEEQYYSYEEFYFKNKIIDFDPRDYDCSYSGHYLFAIGNYKIYVFDTETSKTIEF